MLRGSRGLAHWDEQGSGLVPHTGQHAAIQGCGILEPKTIPTKGAMPKERGERKEAGRRSEGDLSGEADGGLEGRTHRGGGLGRADCDRALPIQGRGREAGLVLRLRPPAVTDLWLCLACADLLQGQLGPSMPN